MNELDEFFMREAIALSVMGMTNGKGGPFGAVIVKNGQIMGKGHNQVTSTNDPTAHAEVVAIRDACQNLGTFQLENCTLYTSCEPCPMCLGAIYWARPERIVFACTKDDAANIQFDDAFIYQEMALPVSGRSIKTDQCLRHEALQAFVMWKEKSDRTNY